MNAIDVLFLLARGKKHTRHFKTENEVVIYLTATHATEAPIAFHYSCGSPLGAEALERIYARVFKRLSVGKIAANPKRLQH